MTFATCLTASRLVLTAVMLVLLFRGSRDAFIASLFVFWSAVATDFLDGYFARKMNQVTTFGTILDALTDKIMIHSLMFSLLFLGVYNPILIFPMFFRDMLVDGLRNKMYVISVFWGANIWGKLKFSFQCLSISFGILSFVDNRYSDFSWLANANLLVALALSLPGLWNIGQEVLRVANARDRRGAISSITKPAADG